MGMVTGISFKKYKVYLLLSHLVADRKIRSTIAQ